MNVSFSNNIFYKELECELHTSTAQRRREWAATIIEKKIDIKSLSNLLKCEQKTASRFLWLLSDIGVLNANKLFIELPFLLELCEQINNTSYKTSFASFWHIVGVPPENEGKAIDLLFQWLISTHTNVTTKSRAIFVLFKLTKKYPELKNELKLCLKGQIEHHTNDFKKRVSKILIEIEQ